MKDIDIKIGRDLVSAARFLRGLGAADADMDALLAYTQNAFICGEDKAGDGFLARWEPVLEKARSHGAAAAVNRYLVKPRLKIEFTAPEALRLELYQSVAGTIPIITTESTVDFESMVKNIVYKGKKAPNIAEMGASFVFGRQNRFILLSQKPYSNVSAERMGFEEALWRKKSMAIRKYHECAHYYTRRYFGSARNNLHDELIADFYGLYSAFGQYRAEWFLKFLGLSGDSDGVHGRIGLYTADLSPTAARVVKKIAELAAYAVEAWSKSDSFAHMNDAVRLGFLCGTDLLEMSQSQSGNQTILSCIYPT